MRVLWIRGGTLTRDVWPLFLMGRAGMWRKVSACTMAAEDEGGSGKGVRMARHRRKAGWSQQLDLLHSFFSAYRRAEGMTHKTAAIHGVSLVAFFTVLAGLNVASTFSIYASASASPMASASSPPLAAPLGSVWSQHNRAGAALMYSKPRHITALQCVCSVLAIRVLAGLKPSNS
jgi:hypothetical protein